MRAPRARWSREEIEQARRRIHAALESTVADIVGLESMEIPRKKVAHALPPRVSSPASGPAFQAAAVLSRFRLDEIRAVASDPDELARLQLRTIALREQGWRTLAPDVRNEVLRALSASEIRGLLQRHARPDDALQTAIDAALSGRTTAGLSTGALAALLQVYDGIAHAATLPPRTAVERKLQLARLLEPLRQITRTFSGRESEIQKLRDYVGVLSTGSWLGDGLRAVGDFLFKPVPKPPFVVHGPGGVGKTTLTARFILEHALAAETQQFPFIYLDFDRPTVNAEQAPTILVEAIRQIGLQYDTAFDASERLRDRWEKRLASRRISVVPFVLDFAGFLDTLELREGPVLMVLDTFEEVQRRSDAYVRSVLQLVTLLTEHVPRLRVVIAGRTMIGGAPVAGEIELTAFDHDSAVAYLLASGVDAETAEAIATLTHGNPLTLTLAIELDRRSPEALRGLDAAQLSDEIIQSLLFDRILLHIDDLEVRRLAHPGLVLRRVTPQVIREVLAGPCEIDVRDDARAEALFDKLAADNTLVTHVEPRVLIHRADVRRMMLAPLRDHEPKKVRAIHRAAVEYYDRQDDLISRAEAAYHRLCLGEEPRLTDDLEPLLVNAMEELPLPSQAILAGRYGLVLSDSARAAADQQTWEQITIRRLTELMQTGNYRDALPILAERSERSAATSLMAIEAMCYEEMDEGDTARDLARRGIAAYRVAGNSTDLFMMLLVAGELDRRAGMFDSAHSYLTDAEEIARRRKNALMLAHVLTDRARLLRTEGAEVEPEIRRELAAAAAEVSDVAWAHDTTLLRRVVTEAALDAPELASRAIRLGALEMAKSDLEYLVRRTGRTVGSVLQELAEAPTRESVEALVAVLRREEQALERRLSEPQASSTNVKLNAAQREQLRDLLAQQYGSGLASFVEVRYGRGIESVSLAASDDVPRTAMDLVRAAERERWLNELIVGLWRSRFMTPEVLQFIDAIGMGPVVRVAKGNAPASEKQLRQLLADYRVDIGALETRTCMVQTGDQQTGCGVLVGRNHLATASSAVGNHVPGFLFDYVARRGKTIDQGRHMLGSALAANTRAGQRLIQLAASLSEYPIDAVRSAPDAPRRGSVTLADRPIDPRAPLFWLWRTREGTFLSGASQSVPQPDGRHIVEAESTVEMRGAPVFDAALNVVGVLFGPSDNDRKLSTIATR